MNKQLFIAIFIGGMIGASGRYSISVLMEMMITHEWMPYATLAVNMSGCFLLSFLQTNIKLKNTIPKVIFTAFTVGVIGSFTTFSTVTIELAELFFTQPAAAIGYFLLNIVGMLSFCYIGYFIGKILQVNRQ